MIYLNELSKDRRKKIKFIDSKGDLIVIKNQVKNIEIMASVEEYWQPLIVSDGKDLVVEIIGAGKHGFAMFSNNNEIIKITDDANELNYIFDWNFITECQTDTLMVPIHKFYYDYQNPRELETHILWKEYALAIKDYDSLSDEQFNKFYHALAIREEIVLARDYDLIPGLIKNLGLHEDRIVFFDSGVHQFEDWQKSMQAREFIRDFSDYVYSVSELQEEFERYFRHKNQTILL